MHPQQKIFALRTTVMFLLFSVVFLWLAYTVNASYLCKMATIILLADFSLMGYVGVNQKPSSPTDSRYKDLLYSFAFVAVFFLAGGVMALTKEGTCILTIFSLVGWTTCAIPSCLADDLSFYEYGPTLDLCSR